VPLRPLDGRRQTHAATTTAAVLLLALASLLGAAGCEAPPPAIGDRATTADAGDAAIGAAAGAPEVPAPQGAPRNAFAVGVRTLRLARTAERRLTTTVFYPTTGRGGGPARRDAPVATGRFPVVLFSHGLNGRPDDYRELLARWTAAGFVVVAPAYPHTARGAASFNARDVLNQPTDASHVLTKVLALDTAEDALRGHLDPTRVAAAGHSAGGITTVGLFSLARDHRLTAGIVLAGNGLGMGRAFTGPAASMLFVHGDRDSVVPFDTGRAAFEAVPWPKAWLALRGHGHAGPFANPASPAFAAVNLTTVDFLRWTLYGDAAARGRLARDARTNRAGRLDDQL
jgi:dienelactone hydrolase